MAIDANTVRNDESPLRTACTAQTASFAHDDGRGGGVVLKPCAACKVAFLQREVPEAALEGGGTSTVAKASKAGQASAKNLNGGHPVASGGQRLLRWRSWQMEAAAQQQPAAAVVVEVAVVVAAAAGVRAACPTAAPTRRERRWRRATASWCTR